MPAERRAIERRAIRRTSAATLGLLFVLGGCATTVSRISPVQPYAAATSTPPSTPPPRPSPSVTATPSPPPQPAKPSPSASPNCTLGPKQKQVEQALATIGGYGAIVVDGKQTLADCQTIKRFQRRMGISPAQGTAGPTTADVAARIAATDVAACDAGEATMACVDLTHQTFYLMKAGKVVVGPTVTRTGMAGFATPAGTYSVNGRQLTHWSTPYKVWLPYWQHFYHDMGLHETTTYIHNKAIGSHGCVNLLPADASKAYSLLGYGSTVRVYGRRPGT